MLLYNIFEKSFFLLINILRYQLPLELTNINKFLKKFNVKKIIVLY